MPVAPQIVQAAAAFRFNTNMLDKSIDALSSEQWSSHPEGCNCLLWVAGHIIWARSRVLAVLGSPWGRPWLQYFERGSNPADAANYPAPEEIAAAWTDVKGALTAALEAASPESLAGPGPEKVPSFDGMLSGTIGFMAWHEGYHVGQAAMLQKWLGRGQIAG
jgi:hypothetical protein